MSFSILIGEKPFLEPQRLRQPIALDIQEIILQWYFPYQRTGPGRVYSLDHHIIFSICFHVRRLSRYQEKLLHTSTLWWIWRIRRISGEILIFTRSLSHDSLLHVSWGIPRVYTARYVVAKIKVVWLSPCLIYCPCFMAMTLQTVDRSPCHWILSSSSPFNSMASRLLRVCGITHRTPEKLRKYRFILPCNSTTT